MSGLQRAMRHPDRRTDVHARARGLASDQLLGPLMDEEARWLQGHLEACPACRRTTASFASDRGRIRALRDDLPVVPRDLGARLSRALDVEVRRATREDARAGRSAFGSSSLGYAAIAIAAVVALMLLPLALGGLGTASGPTGRGLGGNGSPQPTPIAVAAQTVAWVQEQPDGGYVLTTATVDQVCPGFDASACGTLDAGAREIVAFSIKPSAVVLQRNGPSAVLVSDTAVYAFVVPFEERVTQTPVPSSSIAAPGAFSTTPAATGVAATPPATTPVPTGSRSPGPTRTRPPSSIAPVESPSVKPTVLASAAAHGRETATPAETASAEPAATGQPSSAVGATEGATPAGALTSIPPASPAPSAAVTTPIIEGVVLVGPPPAYSPDGQWVAFSARPLDGSQGPDIYVWHVGDALAHALTSDHASVFSAWDLDEILGSAVVPDLSPALDARAITIEPAPSPTLSPAVASPEVAFPASGSPEPFASGEAPGSTAATSAEPADSSALGSATAPASPAASAEPIETPVVSSGSTPAVPAESSSPDLSASPAASTPVPSVPVALFLLDPQSGRQTPITRPGVWRPVVDPTGRIVVFWTGVQAFDPATSAWAPTSGQLVIADWQALNGPGDVTAIELPGSAGLPGVTSWDVRWDPSGRHLAVWIGNSADPSTGSLSLFAVNADGSLGETLLADVAALPGFSLGSDRIAWASPPGQNGQGSTLSVYAWSDDGSGSIHGAPDPGTDPLVVAR